MGCRSRKRGQFSEIPSRLLLGIQRATKTSSDSSSSAGRSSGVSWLFHTSKGAKLSASSVHDAPIGERSECMKKVKTMVREPEMRAEYDFRGGIRGKYAAHYAGGSNVVVLEP